MYAVKYLLLATGSVTTPRLDITLAVDTHKGATAAATKIVKQIAAAGYWSFDLFDISEGTDTLIESYRVEHPEPVVTVQLAKIVA